MSERHLAEKNTYNHNWIQLQEIYWIFLLLSPIRHSYTVKLKQFVNK